MQKTDKSLLSLFKCKEMKRLLFFWIYGLFFFVPMSGQEASFCKTVITDSVFSRINGVSYPEHCTTLLSDLRYLQVLHYNIEGEVCKGELICHHSIAADLLAIFKELYQAKYPIGRMVLVDEYDADGSDYVLLFKNGEKVKFKGIQEYAYIEEDKILYMKNDSLYFYAGKDDDIRIARDVVDYYFNDYEYGNRF